ncbi:MAG: RagB/SusD family nutrient uptake outer membrane protein, partial [Bacteroidales bacterium]
MKMTKFFPQIFILSFLSILVFTSCNDFVFGDASLQEPEVNEVNLDYIFSSKLYAERVLVDAYRTLPYGIVVSASGYSAKIGPSMLDCLTDLLGAKEATPYYTGGVNAALENSSADTKYSFINEGGWQGIRSAFIFIENVDRVPDMTDEEKKIRKAEAKMVIAVHYTEMFRHFGGLPWLDHAVYPNESLYFPRITAEQTVNNIVELIDEAAADLPWALDPVTLTTDDGRFTKAAALGLKVRVLLFAASPLFNDDEPYLDGAAASEKLTWFGGKSIIWWQRAEQACVDFFAEFNQNPGYGIVNTGDPRADFIRGYSARGTGETLISTRRMYMSGGLWAQPYIIQGAIHYR